MQRFETCVDTYTVEGVWIRVAHFYSDAIPDLCAIAEGLTPHYEMVVYWGNEYALSIVEEYDEPGDKGNYGGLWYMPPLYQVVIESWPAHLKSTMPDMHRE